MCALGNLTALSFRPYRLVQPLRLFEPLLSAMSSLIEKCMRKLHEAIFFGLLNYAQDVEEHSLR